MIEARRLVKFFGPRVALAGVDLVVEAGEFVAVVGPNGVGKTTLLRILATLTRPSSGEICIAGLDPNRAGEAVRRCVGFLSHCTLLYDDLTVEQNLGFYARMYDLGDAAARVAALLERVGLADRRRDLVGILSRGMQQRLAVARVVLHRPRVLLLDEPYSGLDPDGGQMLTGLLAELAGEGCAVLWTTNDLERGLAVGGRVAVLSRGRIVYDQPRGAIDPAAFAEMYRVLMAR